MFDMCELTGARHIFRNWPFEDRLTMTEVDKGITPPPRKSREEAKEAESQALEQMNRNLYDDFNKKAQRWAKRYFHAYFVPTPNGVEKFGWTKYLLLPQLLTYAEATDLRDYITPEDDVRQSINFAFVKLIEFKKGDHEMGGYNYQFDATQYEPEQWGGVHPVGIYDATVSSCSVESNKENNGGNFVVEWTTPAGSVRKWYPLWNVNPKAVEGAHKQLAALCHATGRFKVDMNDGGQALVGGVCKIEVRKQKPDDPEDNNVLVSKVMTPQGGLPGKSNIGTTQQGQPPQQPPQGGGFAQGQPQQQGGFGGGQPQQPQPQGGGFGGQPQGQPQGGFQGQPQPQGQGGFGGQPQGGFQQQPQPQPQPDPNQGGGFQQQPQQQGGFQQQPQPQQGFQQQPQQPAGGQPSWAS